MVNNSGKILSRMIGIKGQKALLQEKSRKVLKWNWIYLKNGWKKGSPSFLPKSYPKFLTWSSKFINVDPNKGWSCRTLNFQKAYTKRNKAWDLASTQIYRHYRYFWLLQVACRSIFVHTFMLNLCVIVLLSKEGLLRVFN